MRIARNGRLRFAIITMFSTPVERVARRVGVDRRHRAVMAGVHRLQHVEGLGAAHLADDDAVGAHAQRVADELALRDLADAFDVGRARLHLHDVRLLQPQLDGVFDRDDALVAVDVLRHRVQQCRLAGAGAARDQHVEARACGDLQQARHLARQILLPHHRVERQALLREFADRDRAAVEHERRQDDVDAAAVGEPGIDHRARLVDAPADRGGDALRDVDEMLGVAKPGGGLFELAAALDIDVEGPVGQDVGDVVVVEKRFERTRARPCRRSARRRARSPRSC